MWTKIEKVNQERLLEAIYKKIVEKGYELSPAAVELCFPMSRSVFFSAMAFLKGYHQLYVSNLKEMGFDEFSYPSAEAVYFAEKSLERTFIDEGRYIKYFMEDLDWGNDWTFGKVIVDGKDWELRHTENLWNLLMYNIFQKIVEKNFGKNFPENKL